jgi:hypothetical protein
MAKKSSSQPKPKPIQAQPIRPAPVAQAAQAPVEPIKFPPSPGIAPPAPATGLQRFRATPAFKYGQVAFAWRVSLRLTRLRNVDVLTRFNRPQRSIIFGLFSTYSLVSYIRAKAEVAKREEIHPESYLYWKIYPGSIVEAQSTASSLTSLVNSAQAGGEAGQGPAKIMTLFEVVTTLKSLAGDDRIVIVVLSLSSPHGPLKSLVGG